MNFQSDRIFTAKLWACSGCGTKRDTQQHILNCEAYEKVRSNRDLSNDTDLVNYLEFLKNEKLTNPQLGSSWPELSG